MTAQRTLRDIHRDHLAAARQLRQQWQQSLQLDGLDVDDEMRDLRISVISASHYWLDAAIEARRQRTHKRKAGNLKGFRFVTNSFQQYNRGIAA